MCPGKTWNDDEVPALFLKAAEHNGADDDAIHRIFDQNGIGQNQMRNWRRPDQIQQFLTAVNQSYKDFGRPEVGAAIVKWFSEMGVQ
jgi:HD-like signal output (HDOD) protein